MKVNVMTGREALPLVLVDAFTSVPFGGNPAAICILSEDRPAAWMQAVACEMNQAETAFVRAVPGGFSLRWFTPTIEVALCGHATLAAAHVLWEDARAALGDPIRFHTRESGVLTASRHGEWIELDFPATPAVVASAPAHLIEGLGASPRYVGRSTYDYLVEFESEEIVRGLRPDLERLAKVEARGIIATAPSAGGDDFVSRFFAPASGINEDPVTGSAHCCLGPFWSQRFGKTALSARQISPRGGVLRVRVDGDRVRLEGQAVTVMRGELRI